MKWFHVFILALWPYTRTLVQAADLPPTIAVVEKVPEIDGRIDSEEWKQAWSSGSFKLRDGNPLPLTEGWVTLNNSTLFVAIRCEEPTVNDIRITTLPYEDNQPVWMDDSVEIYIDVENGQKNLFRLAVNAEGTLRGARIINLQQVDTPWSSGAVVKTSRSDRAWEAEIAIPLSAFGHELQRGEVFGINLARTRYASGNPQYGSLIHNGDFLFPELNQQLLVGGPIEKDGINIISTKRGPFFPGQSGAWDFKISARNGADKPVVVNLGDKEFSWKQSPENQGLSIPIEEGKEGAYLQCRLNVGGQEIYLSEYGKENGKMPDQVAVTTDPLFHELIEAAPEGLSQEGTLIWSHEFSGPPLPWDLALRTGTAGSITDAMREYQKDSAIVMSTGFHDGENWQPLFEKAGVKLIMDGRVKNVPGVPNVPTHAWGQDPRVERAVVENARQTILRAKRNPAIWGLAAGDESWEHDESRLRYLLKNRDKRYKEVHAADREIREKYGFGKFGLPDSPDDHNPFAWIATRRWVIDRMLNVQREIRKIVDQECPRLKMVSWDNYPGHYPRDLSKWGEIFDVITGQLYPSRDARMDEFGFVTKWLGDLSGAKEVWPCPHIEHYGGNFRADEVEELLSQTFRAGATGLHLYASDTIGRRQGSGSFNVDRIGAPERWNVVRSVLEQLKTPFRVKQPTPDAAVFYSNSSYQGQPSLRKTGEVEYAYTILGPRLQGAFRFVDEAIADKGADDLRQYKVIYVPYAPIVDDREYNALIDYARSGGQLVVCDPMAFRYRSDGTERQQDTISPLASVTPIGAQAMNFQMDGQSLKLPAMGVAYTLNPGGDTLATYSNGSPAVVQNRLGEGSVIWFGENPLTAAVVANPDWMAFFRYLQQRANLSMGNSVWRFRLPKTSPAKPGLPEGLCLTGNSFTWSLSKPVATSNATLSGSYRISQMDDDGKENANEEIPFTQGRLTDRLKGAQAAIQSDPYKNTLTWTRENSFQITFTFELPVEASLLRFYFSGRIPEGLCEASIDGAWHEVGRWSASSSAKEILPWASEEKAEKASVAEKSVKLQPVRAKSYRITFQPSEKHPFTLAECDLWGVPSVTN